MTDLIHTTNKTYPVDAVFWIAVSTLVGIILSLPAGRSQAYIWIMLVVGIFVSSRSLVKVILMAADRLSGAVESGTVVFEGRAPYTVHLGPIRMANQEKPFYYTLFTRDPVVPYLFRVKTDDGQTMVLGFSLSRKRMTRLGLKTGQPLTVKYLRRSGTCIAFSLI